MSDPMRYLFATVIVVFLFVLYFVLSTVVPMVRDAILRVMP